MISILIRFYIRVRFGQKGICLCLRDLWIDHLISKVYLFLISMTILNDRRLIDTTTNIVHRREKRLILFLFLIILVLDVLIDRRHNIPNLKPDSSNFNQVSFLYPVTRNIHLGTFLFSHNPPDLLLRLLLQNTVQILVNMVLMVNPILAIIIKSARYNRIDSFFLHPLLLRLKQIQFLSCLCFHFILHSEKTMTTFDFKLFPKDFSSLKIKESMRLTCPCDSTDHQLLDFLGI